MSVSAPISSSTTRTFFFINHSFNSFWMLDCAGF
jgi:hypothetical protein